MKLLTEKPIKVTRSLKTFKDLIHGNSRVKNSPSLRHLAPHFNEIESYIQDSRLVFEFECYLKIKNTKRKTISLKDVTGHKISDVMVKYYQNDKAWDKVFEAAKKEFNTDKLYNKTGILVRDYLNTQFKNAFEVMIEFKFSNPIYGIDLDHGYSLTNTHILAEPSYGNLNALQEQLAKVFSIPKKQVKVLGSYHEIKKSNFPNHWFIEPDGSLKAEHGKEYTPIEIVTPYLPIKDAHKTFQLFKEQVFDYFEGITDDSTGFHINISGHLDTLNEVKLVILANDDLWLTKFDREFNEFCESQYKDIKEQIEEIIQANPESSLPDVLRQLTLSYEKYRSFNFTKDNPKTVEFRTPGDDYLGTKFAHSVEAIDWLVYVTAIAANESLFKPEYMSKIIKMMNQYTDTSTAVQINPITNIVCKYLDSLSYNGSYKQGMIYNYLYHILENTKFRYSADIPYRIFKKDVAYMEQSFSKNLVSRSQNSLSDYSQDFIKLLKHNWNSGTTCKSLVRSFIYHFGNSVSFNDAIHLLNLIIQNESNLNDLTPEQLKFYNEMRDEINKIIKLSFLLKINLNLFRVFKKDK